MTAFARCLRALLVFLATCLGPVGCGGGEQRTFESVLDSSHWLGTSYLCGPPLDANEFEQHTGFGIHPLFQAEPDRGIVFDLPAVLGTTEDSEDVFLGVWPEDQDLWFDNGSETYTATDVAGFEVVTVTVFVEASIAVNARSSSPSARETNVPGAPIPDHLIGMGTLDDGSCLAFTAFPYEEP